MTKWKQPLVAVSCNSTTTIPSIHDDDWSFSFYNSFHGNFSVRVDLQSKFGSLKNVPLNGSQPYYKPGPLFLDLQGQVPVPISAAILLMKHVTQSLDKEERPDDHLPNTHLCIVQTRWIDTNVWITGQSIPAALSDIGIPIEGIKSYLQQASNRKDVIRLHAS
ncbi:Fc.00g018480.m01.CDS01 [Cosmosporella sp. VM-42]